MNCFFVWTAEADIKQAELMAMMNSYKNSGV